jgi:putative FmdB family regulatory protein
MPLYDYRCTACDQQFERRHGWDEPAGACPACGSAHVRRMLPTVAVQVKGGTRNRASAAVDDFACPPDGCARPGCPSARLN